jgi:predicted HD phosphohydrolase
MISNPAQYLMDLLDTKGRTRNGGENISVLEHSLQSAHLAARRRLQKEMVVAALLHDVQISPK